MIRYLVFPNIYGYVKDSDMMVMLSSLYEFEKQNNARIFDDQIDFKQFINYNIDEKGKSRLDLLEKAAKHQILKSMIEQDMIQQSSKMEQIRQRSDRLDELLKSLLSFDIVNKITDTGNILS